MNINSHNNEPVTKKDKSDIKSESCIIVKKEIITDENFECQEDTDLTEPITKRNKSNDIKSESCIIVKKEIITDENFEYQEDTDLIEPITKKDKSDIKSESCIIVKKEIITDENFEYQENTDLTEPITKKNKCNDIKNESCIIVKEENNTDENFEYQENAELTDNEDEGMPLSNNDEDDSLFPFPPDTDITDMLDGVNYHGSFPTITERYFTAYYKLDVQSPADDICVLMHSNRICMLTLAPSHTVFQNKDITKVNFKVSDKLDRILNKVSGKSKHGAQPLQTNSNICIITCSNGKTYTIKCCIIGKLVEVNEALLQNPKLLLEPPHKGGYLAIVLPNIKLLDKMKKSLLTQEQYDLKILERQNATNHLETSKIYEKSNSEMINNETKLNENKSQITLSTTS